VSVNYRIARFDESFIQHALREFPGVLTQAVAQPERKLSSIKLSVLKESRVLIAGGD
jgi:hypothetical protein